MRALRITGVVLLVLVAAFVFWSKDVWRRPAIWLDERALYGDDWLDG